MSRLQSAEMVLPRHSKLQQLRLVHLMVLARHPLEIEKACQLAESKYLFELMVSPISEQLTSMAPNICSSISIKSLIKAMSSAYSRSYKGVPAHTRASVLFLQLPTNFASWLCNTFSPQPGCPTIAMAMTVSKKLNRVGAKTSPCRTPFLMRNSFDTLP